MKSQIPPATIGLLSQILSMHYTLKLLNDLFFFTPSALNADPSDSKATMIKKRLQAINKECPEPLEVLGQLLGDFMDIEPDDQKTLHAVEKLEENQCKILETLTKDGLRYLRRGHITKLGLLSTQELQDKVAKQQLSAIGIEIERALETVEKDPINAALYAATVLEASCKAYLNHHSIVYKEKSDTLSNLWDKVATHIGLQPKNFSDEDVRKIASGLYEIVKGTMHLRNKKSAAHGRSEEDFRKNTIRPRHARLAIHAAHTISAYILEFIKEV